MPKLSVASQRVVSQLPATLQVGVKRRLLRLEKDLGRHRGASIALVELDEKGGCNGDHSDWNDVDMARELAEEALGKKEVEAIRARVREELSADDADPLDE